jgi:uncharacterized protein (UPF0335 family)
LECGRRGRPLERRDAVNKEQIEKLKKAADAVLALEQEMKDIREDIKLRVEEAAKEIGAEKKAVRRAIKIYSEFRKKGTDAGEQEAIQLFELLKGE